MQTRPAFPVYRLSIIDYDQALFRSGIDIVKSFYFRSRQEAEHYLAAMFPKNELDVSSAITKMLASPYNDQWIALEETNDFDASFPKDISCYMNELAEVSDQYLIETINTNTECVFPVRLINKPAESQQGNWLGMFSSLWQQPQEPTNKELVLGSWQAENDKQLMLYVRQFNRGNYDWISVRTYKPLSTTFKLSTYVIKDDIATNLKNIDADMTKLVVKKEVELSQLTAKFDVEIANLAAKREALMTKNHVLFGEQHREEAATTTVIGRSPRAL